MSGTTQTVSPSRGSCPPGGHSQPGSPGGQQEAGGLHTRSVPVEVSGFCHGSYAAPDGEEALGMFRSKKSQLCTRVCNPTVTSGNTTLDHSEL